MALKSRPAGRRRTFSPFGMWAFSIGTSIGWIVDVTTLGATLIYGLISHAVYRRAKADGRRAETVTGVIGMALMLCFVILLLIPGLLPFNAMATESYVLFIVWAVLGLAYFRYLIHKDEKLEYGRHFIVWIVLLVLEVFTRADRIMYEQKNALKKMKNEK